MSGRNVLVVAAHPDDEVLGCGGTIAAHAMAGDNVSVVVVAEGAMSRDDADAAEVSELWACAREVGVLLGAASVETLGLPDNRLDAMDRLDLVKAVERVVERVRPDIVYTHHAGDVNIDHRRLHEAVVTACRPVPEACVRTILAFEVASSTEWQSSSGAAPFEPDWFVDVTRTLDIKMAALEVYETEMREWPHARSLKAAEHLARWRGATVGTEAAEAFMLVRHIEGGEQR